MQVSRKKLDKIIGDVSKALALCDADYRIPWYSVVENLSKSLKKLRKQKTPELKSFNIDNYNLYYNRYRGYLK